MSWYVEVDGMVLPRQLSGHPALELVNTRAGWRDPYDGETQDYLKSYDHLLALARLTGVLDEPTTHRLARRADRQPEGAEDEVARARRTRGDLHDVLLGQAGPVATRRLGRALTSARARQRLDLAPGGARWTFAGPPSLADPLDALLVRAGDLLVDHPRIGACPGVGCGWLFLDSSGRRRWCQMAVCGNRAKQAAHARRTR